MKIIVKKIDGHKVSLISAVTLAIISLFFYPFMLITFFAIPSNNVPVPGFSAFFLFFPVIYFGLGYVFTRIFIGIFNFVTKKMNGFYVEIDNEKTEEE